MSRADTYGAYYRDFRARLLHQVYAYCGNTEVAQRSVSDAFVVAGHHWRKLEERPDRDAWMREHAFRATARAQNRARKPWYVGAKSTADEHRAVLGGLSRLDSTDRKLVILRYVAGLDLSAAGREAGVTDSAAQASLDMSLAKLRVAGVDTSPDRLRALLDRIRLDLGDEPVERAGNLRREGNRRRRSHLLLAGISALALAIGAGALTATQSPAQSSSSESPDSLKPAQPTAPAEEPFTADDLATVADVRILDQSGHWSEILTSSDFGDDKPVSECIAAPPTEGRADHYWVRRFSIGSGERAAQASQALEVVASVEAATTTYENLVGAVAACRTASRQLMDFKTVDGVGDEAAMFDFKYVDGDSVRDEMVMLARTGFVIEIWVVRPQAADRVRSRPVVELAGDSVDAVCVDAEGACAIKPFDVAEETPPADDGASGFLETVDLPVLAGITPGWAATTPERVTDNPAATDCDNADFRAGGATETRARTYVVPDAAKLPDVFGMSETVGNFPTEDSARRFMRTVTRNVSRCEDRQLNLAVKRDDKILQGKAVGHVWQVNSAASESTTFVFRVGLVRVGNAVLQVTFTPSGEFDVGPARYVRLTERAAARVAQAQA
jgi:DNA-directed RNA polymerase specialized sigma24 family protein